jgi:dienelactone hydrolase
MKGLRGAVMRWRSALGAAGISALILLILPIWWALAQRQPTNPDRLPVVSEVGPPPGVDAVALQWMQVSSPDVGVLLAAVARPSGAGPSPSVLVLHGSHGFAQEYVRIAQDLAAGGFIGIAACWFQGGSGAGSRFITPINCPQAPPMPPPSSPEAMRTLDAILHLARSLPGGRADRIGLFGHSRGGGAALYYLLERDNVQAVALNSSGYSRNAAELVSQAKAPILILHGTADSPEDGGAPATNVQMARDFEAKLQEAGKPVEAFYYEGGRHNDIFKNEKQHSDEMQRIVSFFRRYLVERI